MMPKGRGLDELRSGEYNAMRERALEALRFLADKPMALQRLLDVSRARAYDIQDVLRGKGPRDTEHDYANELPWREGVPLFTPTGFPYGAMPPVGARWEPSPYQKKVMEGK